MSAWSGSRVAVTVIGVLVVVVPIGVAVALRILSGTIIGPEIFVGIVLSLIPWAAGWIKLSRAEHMRRDAGTRPREVGDAERLLAAFEVGIGLELIAVAILSATFDLRVGVVMLAAMAAWLLIWVPKTTRRLEMKSVVEVQCRPDEAFDFVSDPNHWPLYIPHLELLQPEHGLGIGTIVGARILRDGHPPLEGYERVIAFEPGRRFGTAIVGGRQSTGTYEFIATDGGTRIEYTFRSVRSLASAVAGSFFRQARLLDRMRDNRTVIMGRLKALLEAAPDATV